MNVKIICIGKLKEKYLKEACGEYIKRMSRFANMTVTELPEYKISDNPSPSEVSKAIAAESASLLGAIQKTDYVIAADIDGKELSSPQLAKHINEQMIFGTNCIVFIIGGSCGYDDSVRQRADLRLSFSKLTFPHQLFRVILLEQIYRTFKINAGEKYHK